MRERGDAVSVDIEIAQVLGGVENDRRAASNVHGQRIGVRDSVGGERERPGEHVELILTRAAVEGDRLRDRAGEVQRVAPLVPWRMTESKSAMANESVCAPCVTSRSSPLASSATALPAAR